MKKLFFILLIFISVNSFSATYYVALNGNDSNTGSRESPFATINRAWAAVTSGYSDVIYVRGGIYTYSRFGTTRLTGKNGVSLYAYPNELPIIDFLDYTGGSATEIIRVEDCDDIHIRGFELRHNVQLPTGRLGYGLRISNRVNTGLFENLNIHHCGGWGVIIWGGNNTSGYQSSNNVFYRIDSHHHSDRYSVDSDGNGDPWGGSDGFLMNSYNGYAYPSMGNTFIECRAWWNSDDGWDNRLFNGDSFYDGCWAFWNGYQPGYTMNDPDIREQGGNGYGFKLGSRYATHTASVMRTMHNCLAFENRETGIQCEHSDGRYDMGARIYNNTAYGNGRAGFSHGPISVGVTWLRNNLSYANGYDIASDDPSIDDNYNASTSSYWRRRDFIPVSTDFANLSSVGMNGARGENGELPQTQFLRLSETSNMIDVGINVGLDYLGSAPDIGAYEYGEEVPPPPPPIDPTVTGVVKAFHEGRWKVVLYQNHLMIKR